ncbi:hypothetical protein [Escherichia coli]|uniref:hypothetical protein n=1 Tax=Escherichia coli TaxID=562 RepID=UPI00301BE128
MMSLWDALRMNMMISYQELVRTFLNEETMKAIVICYGSARSLVDTFRMNNQVLEDLAKLQTIFHETQKDIHRFNLEQTYHIATQYGEGLKQIHGEVMSRIAICLDKINVNLDELEKPEQATRGDAANLLI